MPRYSYTAISAGGKKQKGSIAADSAFAARKQLRVRGIHAVDVSEIGSAEQSKSALFSIFTKRKKTQLIDFTQQMATLLKSGIKLTESLSVLSMQVSDPKFKSALNDIRDRVMTGESFVDSLKDYSDYFDVIYVSMVRVGEVTGSLGDSFTTIAKFMEKRHRVESKVITAMIYPLILVIFCLAAVIFLTSSVVPKIGKQIEDLGRELPGITQMLMAFGELFTTWKFFPFAAFVFGLIFCLRMFIKTEKGAFLRDKIMISMPIFGPLIKQRVVARFAGTLSTLLNSGLPMAESLRVVSEVTGNSLMKRAIINSRERILAGADIATPLRDSGVIDPAIAHMVSVGEKSGELETMLTNISENLESSTDVVIERLSAAIEPLIIVIMTAVIGVIAYAILLPILEVSSAAM
jgi:type II secretory pathway component PulF